MCLHPHRHRRRASAFRAAPSSSKPFCFAPLIGAGFPLTALVVFQPPSFCSRSPWFQPLRFGRHLETRLRLAFLKQDSHASVTAISRAASNPTWPSAATVFIKSGVCPNSADSSCAMDSKSFHHRRHHLARPTERPHRSPRRLRRRLPSPFSPNLLLMERDLRLRTHSGALSHFYLDALLGLGSQSTPTARNRPSAVSTKALLAEWARAGIQLAANRHLA